MVQIAEFLVPTYTVNAINIGSFLLGEADKVLTLFTAEKGIVRAVAKGARKPGTKMSGRSDVLSANKLFLSTGKTFEIITQAECIETFPEFRSNLTRMAYALYYAELTQHCGQGVAEESQAYFEYLLCALMLMARSNYEPSWLCLEFELGLLDLLGYRPELTYCVSCRDVLGDYNLATFNKDLGGILCRQCVRLERSLTIREQQPGETHANGRESASRDGAHITPLVWKNLVLAADRRVSEGSHEEVVVKVPPTQSIQAARRLIQSYIEHRAGRHMKALDILEHL